MINALRPLAQEQQHTAGIEVEIDRPPLPFRLLWEMPERVERLLEMGHRLPMGRALRRLRSGLVEKGDGFLPYLAPDRVIGQPLDVLREPLGVEALDRLDGPGVEGAPALL